MDKAYPQYSGLNLPEIEQEILKVWQDDDTFRRSVEERDPKNTFVFYEGPPSANGKPGIHHVMARTVKDLFCRYQTMRGHRVERKGGWDTHGLPVELSVEKKLGITRDDIGEKISVKEYNRLCRETVMRYKSKWEELTRKMGYWVDMDDPYITFENEYIESVWYLLKRLYDKGLIYKGYSIQPFSPAAGTGLSSHELNQPGCYREITDTTVTAQFKIKRSEETQWLYELTGGKPVYALAWTTTPWTLPSNTALGIGTDITYALVQTFNKYTGEQVHVILAEELLNTWLDVEGRTEKPLQWDGKSLPIPWQVIETFTGDKLSFSRYEQLMQYAEPEEGDAFIILPGDFVSTEDGTGIVHLAPSYGADDKRVTDQYGVGALTLVNRQGKFTDEMGDFAGRYVKDYTDDPDYISTDVDLAVKLKKEGKAFEIQKYAHNYPHCWRTDKPILYYPLDSWFVKATEKKEQMAELNRTINWKPAHTGEKRFGHWLENLQDWNLSRSRYWGIPLPIWRTEDATEEKIIGSIPELQEEIEKANEKLGLDQQVPEDLHRPYIDEITLVSSDEKPMKRETDLIDVWFDSGSMPYAQWHYPFENEEQFQRNFPADFIAEGVDQTRGWFYTLHAIAVMAFDSIAYKTVVSNGLVQDKHGQKMSKRLGNTIDPFKLITKYGADAARWYMISNAPPWDNLKFDIQGLEETIKKFFGTLYNTYAFFALYANLDEFKHTIVQVPLKERLEIDRWILSRLNTLTAEVKESYDNYEPTAAARAIQNFVVDELSNWYVRQNRRRYWTPSSGSEVMSDDKLAAYQTLYTCLETVTKLMAPIAPFFSEWLFRNLSGGVKSVHLDTFPETHDSLIDEDLEIRMNYAMKISSLILRLRKKENIRVRQPLRKVIVPVDNGIMKRHLERIIPIIKKEVNIKELELVDSSEGVIKKSVKPDFRALGKRLGKHMKEANTIISNWGREEISRLENGETLPLEFDNESYNISKNDVVISAKDIPGWTVAHDLPFTVALDISLNEELKAEGLARELVNRIQNLRKNSGFEVTDRISIRLSDFEGLAKSLNNFGAYVTSETLAVDITVEENLKGEVQELYKGVETVIELEKV